MSKVLKVKTASRVTVVLKVPKVKPLVLSTLRVRFRQTATSLLPDSKKATFGKPLTTASFMPGPVAVGLNFLVLPH